MKRPNLKKRKRQLSSDAQWCLENKDTLSLQKFVQQYQPENSTRFWTIIKRRKIQLDAHAGAVDYIGDVVNDEAGRKDKDHTRAVTDIAVNENENILLLHTETSQEASGKQAPTSSAFNGNEDYTDSSSVENEEAEAEPQATAIFNPYKD
ncbi:unnamed protein product [Mucor hiemalis]